MPTSSPRAASVRTTWFALGLLALAALAVWMVWPSFTPGRIVNLDAPRHLLRSVVMAEQFLPSGHVDGWSPWWYLGAQLFLFQSYGYFLLIGATAIALDPWLSIGTVFKLWYAVPIVVLPLVTAFLAKRLGAPPRAALAAGLASLVFTSPLGYGVQGVYGMGLLLQGAGVVGFAFAWPEILAVLLDRTRPVWRAVLVLAAVLVVHFITGVYALAASGLVAAGLCVKTRTPWPVLRYAWVAALVLLLAGHTLFPSLELRSLAGVPVGWGNDRDRFDRFLAGTLFGAQPLALAAHAAAVWAIFRGPRPLAVTGVVYFGTALFGGANAQPWEPHLFQHLLEILVRPRALPYAALMQAVFAGVAIDAAVRACSRAAAKWQRPAVAALGSAAVAALVVAVAVPELRTQRRHVKTESMVTSPDRIVYLKLVRWLRRNVEKPAIVAVPRTLFPQEALGPRSVISLLNLDTGLYTLGGDQAELTRSTRRSGRVDLESLHVETARNVNALRYSGVSYVIVSDPVVRLGLLGSSELILEFEYERKLRKNEPKNQPKLRNGKPVRPVGVAVYRVKDGGAWLHGHGIKVHGMEHQPERIRWTISGPPGKPRNVTASINWHPGWQAFADGKPVDTRISPGRHVLFTVPAGTREVSLEFLRRPREKAYNALSAATLVFVAAGWGLGRRRRAESVPDEPERSPAA